MTIDHKEVLLQSEYLEYDFVSFDEAQINEENNWAPSSCVLVRPETLHVQTGYIESPDDFDHVMKREINSF
jgi:hypothetical protein